MSKVLLAQLAHVELITPQVNESAKFFVDVMGLTEVKRTAESVYLRCWGDYYQYSLMLTQGKQSALGHACWRTVGPEELDEAVARLKAAGVPGEWIDNSYGHGRSYRFQAPGGHQMELVWEVQRYQAEGDLQSTYPERPQKLTNHGIAPRQLDHVTVSTKDVVAAAEWFKKHLGFRFMAVTYMHDNPDQAVFATVTTNEKSHDLGLGVDFSDFPAAFTISPFGWIRPTSTCAAPICSWSQGPASSTDPAGMGSGSSTTFTSASPAEGSGSR